MIIGDFNASHGFIFLMKMLYSAKCVLISVFVQSATGSNELSKFGYLTISHDSLV